MDVYVVRAGKADDIFLFSTYDLAHEFVLIMKQAKSLDLDIEKKTLDNVDFSKLRK